MKTLLVALSFALAVTTYAKEKEIDGDLDLARHLENAFVKVATDASESVVVISTTQKAASNRADADDEEEPNGRDQFEGTPFEYFFKQHRIPMPEPHDLDSQGSGIILRADGYILTNNHVVRDADEIKVRLKDGKEFDAKVVGVDDRTDVAVIKVEGKDLHAARFGNSDEVKVGQWAIAIGAPYQLDYSFTVGFISAKGRSAVWSRNGSAYEDYIQTDASINPGNSGGPLCDIEGRVIGINTLIRGLNRGIGFAIPINMAREVADQLIDKGKIVRPWLGIEIRPLDEYKELAESLTAGVVVKSIYPETPAANSDLKPADIIVTVDGIAVKTPRDLQREILHKQVGTKVSLGVVRDGKPVSVKLQTGELPDSPQLASSKSPHQSDAESTWGLTVQTLTKDLAEKFNVEHAKGVLVTEVEDGSIAQRKGLQRGDIITEINRAPIATADAFKTMMAKVDKTKGALLYVQREGASTFVVLKETE